jgi:hypothetical protein
MRYFDLADDMSERMRNRWHLGRVRLHDGTVVFPNLGLLMDAQAKLTVDVTHIGRVLEYCRTSFNVPIANGSLTGAIKSVAGEDVQCLPVTIAGQAGMMVLNAVRTVRCVHEGLSEYDKWTEDMGRPDKLGQYHYISKLILDKAAIPPDAHFFRVKDWTVCLIVSETVKNAMERVGCYGAEFTELEMA